MQYHYSLIGYLIRSDGITWYWYSTKKFFAFHPISRKIGECDLWCSAHIMPSYLRPRWEFQIFTSKSPERLTPKSVYKGSTCFNQCVLATFLFFLVDGAGILRCPASEVCLPGCLAKVLKQQGIILFFVVSLQMFKTQK